MRFFTALVCALAGVTSATAEEKDGSASDAGAKPSGWDYGTASLAREPVIVTAIRSERAGQLPPRDRAMSNNWDYGAVTSSSTITALAARRTVSTAWDYGSNIEEDSSAEDN
jgi:hypothetical protein